MTSISPQRISLGSTYGTDITNLNKLCRKCDHRVGRVKEIVSCPTHVHMEGNRKLEICVQLSRTRRKWQYEKVIKE